MIAFALVVTACTELLERLIETSSFNLSPSRFVMLALLALSAIGAPLAPGGIRLGAWAKRYAIAAAVLALALLVSLGASPYPGYSIKRVFNTASIYLMPLIIYVHAQVYAVNYDRDDLVRWLTRWVIFAGIASAVFGLVQEATGILQLHPETRNLFSIPFSRINGLHWDGNFMAYFMVFPLWILLAGDRELLAGMGPFLRVAGAGLCLVALLLTGSRGGAAMIAALVCSVALRKVLGRPGAVQLVQMALMVLLPLGLILFGYAAFERIVHAAASVDTSNESGMSRILAWYSGVRLYVTHPLTGVGPGNFVTMDKGNFLPGNYVYPWVADRISVLAGHSNVIEILVESGPIALAGYFGMQGVVLKAIAGVGKSSGDASIYADLWFAAACGNALISYHSIFVMVLVGVLLYCADRPELAARESVAPSRNPIRHHQARPGATAP